MNMMTQTQVGWNLGDWSILIDTDSYKVSMWKQYPPESHYLSSYVESRGGEFANVVFFGLHPFLKRLARPITADEVAFADVFWTAQGLPFNREGWDLIVTRHNGRLPIRIQAIPEGTVAPTKNAVVQIVNTDPDFWWLPTWVETALLRAVWYPSTVASLSWTAKQIIGKFLNETSDIPDVVLPTRLHDFGSRGVSSFESATLGGPAHLLNFVGTDTGAGTYGAIICYGAPVSPAVGGSIPAAEHSTITSWGREGEIDAYANMVDQFAGPGKLYSVVSDSYDVYHAASELWGNALRQKVKDMGGTLVVRPDSGDPTVVPVEIIRILGEKFGYTVNSKGYKVLDDSVRVIQGDGIDLDIIVRILKILKSLGWSAENIAFGMGGQLLQGVTRDTMKWAMKASAIMIGDEPTWRDVMKDPITDPGKRSKAGRLAVKESCGIGACGLMTDRESHIRPADNILVDVFIDGEIRYAPEWSEIVARTNDHGMADLTFLQWV